MDGVTGLLVDPTSVSEVATAVVRLLMSEDDARRMGDAGRERVCRDFDKNQQLRLIESALVRCVGRPMMSSARPCNRASSS
jgi:glycosyltransferase involved in cell wall biosynthesis